jgi:predicted aspartyl protease
MILGRFETFSKRPIVDCFVSIPSLNAHGVVPFLMDTGADCTLLMPADGARLKIDYAGLDYKHTSIGVGGECKEHPAATILMVSNATTVYAHKRAIGIAERRPELMEMPSILGMDVLREWEIVFNYPEKLIKIIVKNCDEQRSL